VGITRSGSVLFRCFHCLFVLQGLTQQLWGLKVSEFGSQGRFTRVSGLRSTDAKTWVSADIIFPFFGAGVNLARVFFSIGKFYPKVRTWSPFCIGVVLDPWEETSVLPSSVLIVKVIYLAPLRHPCKRPSVLILESGSCSYLGCTCRSTCGVVTKAQSRTSVELKTNLVPP
jgi:hypothetical protein